MKKNPWTKLMLSLSLFFALSAIGLDPIFRQASPDEPEDASEVGISIGNPSFST